MRPEVLFNFLTIEQKVQKETGPGGRVAHHSRVAARDDEDDDQELDGDRAPRNFVDSMGM